jgi:hypothetical protein
MELIPALSIGLTVGVAVVLARLVLEATPAWIRMARAKSSANAMADWLVRSGGRSWRALAAPGRAMRLHGASLKPEPAAAMMQTPGNTRLIAAPLTPLLRANATPAAEEPRTVTCVVCQREHSIYAKFCRSCGAPSSETGVAARR